MARAYDANQQKTITLGTYDKASEAQDAIDAHYGAPKKTDITVRQLRDRWLQEKSALSGWKEATHARHEYATKGFTDKHGARKASSITREEAYEWAVKHRGQVQALRGVFQHGISLDLLKSNPFQGLSLPKRQDGEIRPGRGALTEDELKQLADVAYRLHGEWHRALILFAGYSCLRAGELYELRFTDLQGEEIHVSRALSSYKRRVGTPKNGQARVVVYPPGARDAVVRVPRRPDQKHVFVFPSGRSLSHGAHAQYWREVRAVFVEGLPEGHWLKARAASGSSLVFHELRHTGATLLLEWGLSPFDVSVQLGHRDGGVLVMRVYGHRDRRAALGRVRRAFEGEVVPLRGVKSA